MSNQFPSVRPRRLRQNESLRTIFQETEFRLEDLILPIFVEEGIDDFVPITSMPGVNRIPEKLLAQEIERYARAGIKSVMPLAYRTTWMPMAATPGTKTAWLRACRVSARTPCRKWW